MIDDVLDFSRAERSGFTLNNVEFELDKLVEDLNALFLIEANNKNLTLNINLDNAVPVNLYGDPVRLAQVISNLLNNAIKFTDQGKVELTVQVKESEADKKVIQFVITDTGKGIAKQKIHSLFDPFTQEDTSINRRYGGSGLGLSIAKRLAVAMGGDITIDSEVDQGTTVVFTVKFITNETSTGEHQIEDVNPHSIDNMLPGIRVLVAEDNEFNQQLLVKLLEQQGAVCTVAKNGKEAISMSSDPSLDLILMDLHMPVINGLEATKAIVKNVTCPPIIGLTADISQQVRTEFIGAGANSVQQKPIDEKKLVNGILDALEQQTMPTEYFAEGMLSSVIPVADLKREIENNLDKLEISLRENDQAAIRSLLHDLMGFCGLYGIPEIRDLVLELKKSAVNLSENQRFDKINAIRRYIAISNEL
jgi:CheY-like chemotaxis protein/anti-sigma regulatory factor (Ser/Thr protein kinase)